MAHPMENRINLFSLIRGSLYAYLRSTVRGNIRHDTRAPETGVPFYVFILFCLSPPPSGLFVYIFFEIENYKGLNNTRNVWDDHVSQKANLENLG